MTPLESLTAKIHALCPELCLTARGKTFYSSPINLDHVLKALGLAGLSYEVCSSGPGQSWLEVWERSTQSACPIATLWELGFVLSKQGEGTIKFLDDLLPSPQSK